MRVNAVSTNGLMHDGLDYWARRSPEKVAVVLDHDQRLTYAELARWSDGVAEHLQQSGIGPGQNVAIAAANAMAWVAAAFGVLKTGATIAPFNDHLLGEELAYLAEYSEASLIIADGPRAARLDDAGVATARLAFDDIEQFRGGATPGWRPVRVSSDTTAMIIFTSGSTARPKGAMMPHGNYLAKFMELRLLDARLGPDTRSLMPFGLHSSPGLPWGILFTTTLGGTLYCTAKYEAARTLRTLTEERITFFIGVPMVYDQIAQLPAFAEAELGALTFARVGGATPALETLARWRDAGVIVRQLYGMTEVGGGSIIASEDEARSNPASCGRGLAFSRFRIVRDDGSDCAADEPGHVLLQGPGMMGGYWRQPEATAEALIDGWMHTGDIGQIDADGYFVFVDRSKEMIKAGGYNVSPSEVEAVLARHDAVIEAAVFAIKDDRFAETPCACIYTAGEGSTQEILDFCAERLAGFKLPRFIASLDEPLPRLSNEKIDRRTLKARFADSTKFPPKLEPSRRQPAN